MPFAINQDGSFPEIGGRYDIGLATRDGLPLQCKNKDGVLVPVSRMAYMLSIDKQKTFKEATELQEKSKLVQLGTSTSIDREFDQWVQNTQGDWSGGLGQRVYGSQGVVNQYFDGEGLLWPINDWIPQVALRGPTQQLPAFAIAGPSAPDFGTETCAPSGSLAVAQACAVLASLKAAATPVALVGVKGAFTQGTNVTVNPPYGQGTVAGHFLLAWVGGQRATQGGSANLGDTAAATSSFDFSQVNSDNVIGTADIFTVPAGGIYVNAISAYFGGYSGAVNARLCVWNSDTGSLIVDSAQFNCPQGRALRTQNVTQTFIAAGTHIRIGFWRQRSQDATWGVAGSGSFVFNTNQNDDSAAPVSGCTSPYVCGNIQAYLTYTTLVTADITCATAGWLLIGQQNSPDGTQQVQLWGKPNCGVGEVTPVFNATAGSTPMHAQCAEYSNVVLASVVDQQSSNSNTLSASITTTNPGTDNVVGDLVVMAGRWSLNGAGAAGFTDVFNNGITDVHAGDSGASSLVNHSSFAYGVVPTGQAAFSSWAQFNGMAGGYIDGLGMGYAVCYLDNQGPPGHWHAVFYSGDQAYDVDLGINTGNKQGPLHMHVAGGYLWVLFSEYPNANNLSVRMLGCNYGSNAFVQLRNDNVTPAVAGTSGFQGLIQAAFVGGKLYVAVLQTDQNVQPGAPATNRNALYVGDYSAGTAAVPSGLAAAAFVLPFERGFRSVDMAWQGNQIILSVSDGFNAYIYQLVAPFTTITTQAVIPGIANALCCNVGAVVFIIAWTPGPTGVNRMELYSLIGSTLTEIPFTPVVPFLDSVTSCTGFGAYAIWAVSYPTPGGPATQKTVSVYAYDVVRGRIFRALTYTTSSWVGSDLFGHDIIGVYGVTQRTLQVGATFQAQLGMAIFSGFLSNSKETAREFYWGVQPLTPAPSFTGLLQLGVDIISGLFDFTASTNKLFRAKLAHFIDGLIAGSATPSVTLNAWFDQDPNRLAAVPDYTSNTGTPVAPLSPQLTLDLFEGRIAVKTVYEVISAGGGYDPGSNTWRNASKIIDVIIAAATGWVLDLVVDLNPNVRTNGAGQNEYAYTQQSPTDATGLSYDHVVAYNFLKQLWRQRGGKCITYLPNGDTYPSLMQVGEWESPKPIAGIGRSDVQATWQVFATLKIREDI